MTNCAGGDEMDYTWETRTGIVGRTHNGEAHLPTKVKRVVAPFDATLFYVTLFLVGGGICLLFSASYPPGIAWHNSPLYYVWRQMIFAAIGIVLMVICSKVDLVAVRRLSPFLLLATAALLALVWTPLGKTMGHARRWLAIGPFALQPSEFAKLTLTLFLAHVLSSPHPARAWWEEPLVKAGVAAALICGLILFQPHLSVVVILLAVSAIVCALSGIPRKLIVTGVVVSLMLGLLLVATAKPYQMERVEGWLRSFFTCVEDPDVTPYQVIQSLKGFRTGGPWGVGFCEGKQKLLFLPSAHNDFIFSVIGEEFGLVGSLFIIALFVILMWKGFHIAHWAEDQFCTLLAAGLTTMITLQAMLNMAVATNSAPTTGAALPFISYGGSALIASLMMIGFILNVSRHPELQTWRALYENPARRRRNGGAYLSSSRDRGSSSIHQPYHSSRVRRRS